MAERFWENLSIILAERNISWIELTRKMFAGEFHYPSELNRLYQKIRHYKMVNCSLKLLGSCNPLISVSQVARTTSAPQR